MGLDGLGQWILNHYKYVQSAYVTAIRAGYPSDCVVWLMPVTNSVEDPPNGAVPYRRSEAINELRGKLRTTRHLDH